MAHFGLRLGCWQRDCSATNGGPPELDHSNKGTGCSIRVDARWCREQCEVGYPCPEMSSNAPTGTFWRKLGNAATQAIWRHHFCISCERPKQAFQHSPCSLVDKHVGLQSYVYGFESWLNYFFHRCVLFLFFKPSLPC